MMLVNCGVVGASRGYDVDVGGNVRDTVVSGVVVDSVVVDITYVKTSNLPNSDNLINSPLTTTSVSLINFGFIAHNCSKISFGFLLSLHLYGPALKQ